MRSAEPAGPVLVVDDDPDIREALHDLLQDEGYPTAEASDGEQALAYLASNQAPSVILLDWNMAPVSGAQFMDSFSQTPFATQVPVVLVTADARVHETARNYGFAAQLSKPVKLEQLFVILDRYCR